MGYGMGYGAYGGGSAMMLFGWVFYIVLLVLMCLGIAALWKYINKK